MVSQAILQMIHLKVLNIAVLAMNAKFETLTKFFYYMVYYMYICLGIRQFTARALVTGIIVESTYPKVKLIHAHTRPNA